MRAGVTSEGCTGYYWDSPCRKVMHAEKWVRDVADANREGQLQTYCPFPRVPEPVCKPVHVAFYLYLVVPLHDVRLYYVARLCSPHFLFAMAPAFAYLFSGFGAKT